MKEFKNEIDQNEMEVRQKKGQQLKIGCREEEVKGQSKRIQG